MEKKKYNLSWPGWEIVRPIGKGSFGTVYEIQRDVYGDIEKAALKVISIPYNESEVDYLRCTGLDDASITQTFHQQVGDIAREYKLMAQLRENPNIVRCDDFRDIQHDDGLGWDIYIKMELLTPLIKGLGKVTTQQQIIRFGMDICNALIDCQKKNIIHRDIKPQNVFISESGRFKLGDFGIARTMERTTHATAGIGTYSYMAPEVEKNEIYGKTADIYSLGLMMYWLNERRGPFMPLPPAALKYADEELARKRRFAGELLPDPKHGDPVLKEIVLRACSFNPKDRFESAAEMYVALKKLLKDDDAIGTLDFDVDDSEVREEEEKQEGTVSVTDERQIAAMQEGEAQDNDEEQKQDNEEGTVSLIGGRQSVFSCDEKKQPEKEQQTDEGDSPTEEPQELIGIMLPVGNWQCVCDRINAPYVSTCACGINKRKLQLITGEERKKVEKKIAEKVPFFAVDGSWGCICGRTNASYVSTCTCGMNKREVRGVAEQKREETDTKLVDEKGNWWCFCGRFNAAYVSTCACGRNKREVAGLRFSDNRMGKK